MATINLILIALFALLLGGVFDLALPRYRLWKQKRVSAALPYHVFTNRFDVETHVRDIPDALLHISPDSERGFLTDAEAARQSREALFDTRVAEWGDMLDVATVDRSLRLVEPDAALILLLDHSGSLRGDCILQIAASVQLFSEIAARNGVCLEILGFSTAGWQGGFVRNQWLDQHKPSLPGRLCALHHIIHKSFDEPTLDRAGFLNILNENLLRENVDGEAILWAASRLRARKASRRFLVVISDGAPVDDTTLLQNDDRILWRHWHEVVGDIETSGDIAVGAVLLGGASIGP